MCAFSQVVMQTHHTARRRCANRSSPVESNGRRNDSGRIAERVKEKRVRGNWNECVCVPGVQRCAKKKDMCYGVCVCDGV